MKMLMTPFNRALRRNKIENLENRETSINNPSTKERTWIRNRQKREVYLCKRSNLNMKTKSTNMSNQSNKKKYARKKVNYLPTTTSLNNRYRKNKFKSSMHKMSMNELKLSL